MALIKCVECSKYVSDKASVCSRCKAPIGKNNPMAKPDIGSKWETVGLFMALTGAATFLFGGHNVAGIVMTVAGLIVYGAGKLLIGKYI